MNVLFKKWRSIPRPHRSPMHPYVNNTGSAQPVKKEIDLIFYQPNDIFMYINDFMALYHVPNG